MKIFWEVMDIFITLVVVIIFQMNNMLKVIKLIVNMYSLLVSQFHHNKPVINKWCLKKRINQQTKKIPYPKQLQLMTHLFQGMFNLTMCQCHRSWQSLELDTVVCLYQEGVWALYLTGNRVSEVFWRNKAFCWQVGPRPLSSCQNGFGLRIVI